MKVYLKDIIIPERFLKSYPNEYKLANVAIDYENGEDIEKEIVVNASCELIDGYIRYLVLLRKGCFSADVTVIPNKVEYENKKSTVYVFGKHHPNGKTYVWRMTKRTKHPENLEVGARVQVATQRGDKRVTVERIEILDKPPVDTPIRKVKECYIKQKK